MPVEITGLLHVGIRVRDRARSVAFYRHLGFEERHWHEGPRVSILVHPSGLEINLIVNATDPDDVPNQLMDVPAKHAGYTHASFRVPSAEATLAALREAGIAVSEGPVNLGGQLLGIFVRDPDGNVVELSQPIG